MSSVTDCAAIEIDGILKLNPQQKEAAKNIGNTIVSAGAGCGKTQTMVGRIVYKILDNASLSEMLIITFTRAAAAGIKKKMSDAFSAIHNSPKIDASVKERFDEAAYSMPVSEIGTIHSFCQRLIRTYFHVAEIDPARTICDEREASLLKSASIKAAIKEGKQEGGDFVEICKMLSDRRTDNGAEKAILRIVDYALSLPNPEEFFARIKNDEDYFADVDKSVADMYEPLAEKVDAVSKSITDEGLDDILDVRALTDYFNLVDGAKRPELPRKRKLDDPSKTITYQKLKDLFSDLRDECDNYVKYAKTIAEAKKNNSVPYATALMNVARAAYNLYGKKKEERGVIDYSDLEHGAIKILSDDECLMEVTSRIKYVFIDEYQDVNPLQNSIAEKFKEAGADVFLVGDIKQSIYGFRRCEPRFFKEALEKSYDKSDKNSNKDNNYTRFDLTGNYRSSKEVIEFVNGVFSAVMTDELGDVNYADDNHSLVSVRAFPGRAEFALIDIDAEVSVTPSEQNSTDADSADKSDCSKAPDVTGETPRKPEAKKKEEKTKELQPYSVINAASGAVYDPEACYISKRILELVQPNENGESEARYGDITILLRSTSNEFAATLFDTLGLFGIPVSIGRKAELKEFPEAVALLDIARCVDTAVDDLALYTALRSPMGGFNDEELAEIASGGAAVLKGKNKDRRETTFADKAAAYKGRLKGRLNEFFALREKFRTYTRCHDAADTLGYITSELDYFSHVYSTCGAHAASAVEALIGSAVDKKCDLHTFIGYCSSPDFELSASSVGDTVKIETIHKSKGLEYKYCFVAGCSKGFNFSDVNSSVIIDRDGIAIKTPSHGGLIGETIPHLLAREKAKSELYSEEMRMLYVALTRAENTLIVTGKTRKKEGRNKSGYIDYLKGVPFLGGEFDLPLSEVTVNGREHKNELNDDVTDEVLKRCLFEYPIKNINVKTSVTAVAEASDEYKVISIADDGERVGEYAEKRRTIKPKNDGGESARLKGTAYHKAMELIDFSHPDFNKIRGDIDNVELIEEDENGVDNILKAVEEIKKVTKGVKFIKERHFIADLVKVTQEIKKETKAVKIIKERYSIHDFSDVALSSQDDEVALVQGIIDLIVVDGGGEVTIVDYKTTKEEGLNSDAYETQLALYKSAVEVSTGIKVKRAVLYSFEKGFIPPVKEW